MRSLALGSIAAAVVMYVLGFVFFGLLGDLAFDPLDPANAAAIQDTLGSSLAHTGTYLVPHDEAAWRTGPGAMVSFVIAGGAPGAAAAMIGGFAHILVSAALIGLGVKAVGGDFARRSRAVLWLGIAAAVMMHLGDPVWMGFGWRYSLYACVADAVMFVAGGLVLARWFTSSDARRAPVGAATAAE